MKIGIVSDTHSNLFALEEVLNHMNSVGVDIKVHCGDIIGYGPHPTQTLALTLENFNYIVMGNHDLAVAYPTEAEYFNPQAKEAVNWTRSKLTQNEIEVLASLRYGHLLNDILFVHGSPQDNNHHGYLITQINAMNAFSNPVANFKVSFVGHTHVPFVWYENSFDRPRFQARDKVEALEFPLSKKGRTIFNVGSVGQPRDNDPRASYAIYDTEKEIVTFYKIPYAIDKTVASMQRAGFESYTYERLMYGR